MISEGKRKSGIEFGIFFFFLAVQAVHRALEIVLALGTFGLKLGLDQSRGELDRNKRKRAAELRTIFTRLGPTFAKLGQGLSTRPDLCPSEYLEELSKLQVLSFL